MTISMFLAAIIIPALIFWAIAKATTIIKHATEILMALGITLLVVVIVWGTLDWIKYFLT